jgi:hypothetical protein
VISHKQQSRQLWNQRLCLVAQTMYLATNSDIRARATRKASGEGVLGRLPCSDRAGGDLVECSQQSAGAGGPGLCYAALHARSAAKLLSADEARRIAANIATLPELLRKMVVVHFVTTVIVITDRTSKSGPN